MVGTLVFGCLTSRQEPADTQVRVDFLVSEGVGLFHSFLQCALTLAPALAPRPGNKTNTQEAASSATQTTGSGGSHKVPDASTTHSELELEHERQHQSQTQQQQPHEVTATQQPVPTDRVPQEASAAVTTVAGRKEEGGAGATDATPDDLFSHVTLGEGECGPISVQQVCS